jgi:hypothetical protein
MRRTGPPQESRPQHQRLLTGRRRPIAWLTFLALAAYTPVMAWLARDDTWLFPLAVAAMVGYVLIVDDHLLHQARRAEARAEMETRGHPVDSPGSSDAPVDASMNADQRLDP